MLMIHPLMETVEARSTIIHMHSLSRCNTLLAATWPPGCAHVGSFVRYLEFMNTTFQTQGNINSSHEYGWSLNVFSRSLVAAWFCCLVMHECRILRSAKIQMCGNVRYFQHWQSWVGKKEREVVLFKGKSWIWAPFHQKLTAGISFVLFLLHF